ncbi:autotransporter outer membrane beta-barrel domain-containing protein [Yersinia massiliensis]|uniref:Autotransporter outer membrane beta-barrel domain-containing protein n=1 Tax=Yersinia massiliensis TaxID=419257 RepID=A0AA91B9U1_9GAMM|nr:autotransporter outer membrane beta-barrel domain-containing protein [Yersinia massiliensis]MDA5549455.1 autotransporter outer membrane beta-barrel domain-containing protein [Yersinia massiliensis]NIL27474.1 autotransporter outer membrane beta-barrel domain-containing protein [Yersinia massiliensis]UZM80197.1 autotransporter outer membrane beta-barrel domain-containing protein [Yersinia massiliensis]
MNHRNTLNTHLLPLSILISSLIASGTTSATSSIPTKNNISPNGPQVSASNVTQVPTGSFQRIANGGSFFIGHSPAASTKSPIDVLIEGFVPAGVQITPEMIEDARFEIEEVKASNEQSIKDYEDQLLNLVAPDEKRQATNDLAKIKDSLNKKVANLETALAYAINPSDENKIKLTATAKDVFVDKVSTQDGFTTAEAELLVTAHLANDLTGLPSELKLKVEALQKLDNYLKQGVITQEQREKLGANLNDKQSAIADTVAFGKQVTSSTHDVADKSKIIASVITDNGKIDLAAGAHAFETVITEGTMISRGGKDFNTLVGAKGLLELAGTDKDNIATSHNAQVREGGKVTVGEFAKINNLNSTKGEIELKTGASASNTTIDGGTLAIKAGAKAERTTLIGAVLDLIEGATANHTIVGADSIFTLKSNATTSGAMLEADSSQFVLESGASAISSTLNNGVMTVKSGASVKDTTLQGREGSELILESGAKAEKTTMHSRAHAFTIQSGAEALDTRLYFAELSLANGAKADGTLLLEGSSFTLLDGAETKDTHVHNGTFSIKKNAIANNTILNRGEFIVNEGATANNTTVNGGQFDLAGTANDTILNSGEFTITDGATANNTTVKGGKFNVMARARAMKLELENGIAMIAGQLEDATLNGGSAIFDKTAEISGTINSNTNNVLSVYEGAKTADVDLNLGGNLQLIGANAPQSAFHRAAMTNPAQFAFKNVTLNGGTIDMSSTNTQLTMASLAGNGNFTLASSLYNQANAPLNVLGDANGTFDIQIKDNGVAPTNLKLIDVQGANNARFTLNNGAVNLGNYLHTLVSDGQGGFKLVADLTKLTPSTAGVLAVANTLPVIFNAELSSIQNRLDKQSTSANKSGVWVNYLNDNFKVSGTAANFDQKLSGMTFGGDKAIEIGDSVLSIGGFGSYSNSDIKSDYQSSGSVKSNSLGAYAQYLTNNGYYLNGVLKANQFKQKLNIASQSHSVNGNANVSGLGIAVKAGKHINLDAAYISPYVALSTFTSGKNSSELSNGMKVENKGSSNTTGTLGMNAGYRFVLNNGAEIKPYALLSVDQDLKASNDVMINSEMFDNSRKGTRVNAGLGANVNVTKNLSVGSEVKVSKGKNVDTPVTINLGVAYTF